MIEVKLSRVEYIDALHLVERVWGSGNGVVLNMMLLHFEQKVNPLYFPRMSR